MMASFNRYRHRFIFLIICACLLLTIIFKKKELSKEQFIQSIAQSTVLETICKEGIKQCFTIEDKTRSHKNDFIVVRYILVSTVSNAYLTAARLKMPSRYYLENTNTSTWDIDKTAIVGENYCHYMMAGFFASGRYPKSRDIEGSMLQIGLGGGQLNNFIQEAFPKVDLTVVDIDPMMKRIASRWFGLREGPNLRVNITDGLKFVEDMAKTGKKYKFIMIDACYNNVIDGYVCPVKQFLDVKVFKDLEKIVEFDGIVAFNLLFMPDMKQDILDELYRDVMVVFKSVHVENVKMSINKVIYMSMSPLYLTSSNIEEGLQYLHTMSDTKP